MSGQQGDDPAVTRGDGADQSDVTRFQAAVQGQVAGDADHTGQEEQPGGVTNAVQGKMTQDEQQARN